MCRSNKLARTVRYGTIFTLITAGLFAQGCQFTNDVPQRAAPKGMPIITPVGRTVVPAQHLIIEDPFGRGRDDMKDLVDLSVCIDIPMEIALARRLLESFDQWSGTPDERIGWAKNYLNSYLFESMRDVYIAINEGVKSQCDLVLDGCVPVNQNVERVLHQLT